MGDLTNLERAILAALADQVPEHAQALREQAGSATALKRDNTGVGFFTRLAVGGGRPIRGAASPIGPVHAKIEGVEHGMGFLLWLEDGLIETLEAYTYGEATSGPDPTLLRLSSDQARDT